MCKWPSSDNLYYNSMLTQIDSSVKPSSGTVSSVTLTWARSGIQSCTRSTPSKSWCEARQPYGVGGVTALRVCTYLRRTRLAAVEFSMHISTFQIMISRIPLPHFGRGKGVVRGESLLGFLSACDQIVAMWATPGDILSKRSNSRAAQNLAFGSQSRAPSSRDVAIEVSPNLQRVTTDVRTTI